jgi:hypothetical protein
MEVLPICPFPSIYWWSIALRNESIYLDKFEHYPKQTYRNRYDILGVNGKVSLTIPVIGQKGIKTSIKEIQIAHGTWMNTHLGTIRSAYGKSAFFDHFYPLVEKLYLKKDKYLIDYNLSSIEIHRKLLIGVREINLIDEHIPFGEDDIRLQFEPSSGPFLTKEYPQVFADRFTFQNNLSSLDLLFNMGPKAIDYILLKKIGNEGH